MIRRPVRSTITELCESNPPNTRRLSPRKYGRGQGGPEFAPGSIHKRNRSRDATGCLGRRGGKHSLATPRIDSEFVWISEAAPATTNSSQSGVCASRLRKSFVVIPASTLSLIYGLLAPRVVVPCGQYSSPRSKGELERFSLTSYSEGLYVQGMSPNCKVFVDFTPLVRGGKWTARLCEQSRHQRVAILAFAGTTTLRPKSGEPFEPRFTRSQYLGARSVHLKAEQGASNQERWIAVTPQ